MREEQVTDLTSEACYACEEKMRWRIRWQSHYQTARIHGRSSAALRRTLETSEQRYRYLFYYMPIAMLQLDARGVAESFKGLRAEGVTDLSPYLDQHPDFLYRIMDALLIQEVNEHAIKMFGARDRSEMLGPTSPYWRKNPDTFRRAMESWFRGQPAFQEETKFLTHDGREMDALFSAARLGPMDELGISLVWVIDISERVRAQERLQQVRAEFAHAARISVLGELTALIAHEITQPLTALLTNGETALRWLDRPEPNMTEACDLIRRIADDGHRAADVIARIRSMAAGRAPQLTVLSLHDVIEDSMIFLRHELQSKGVAASVDLAPALPQVTGDRAQLQQVVVNLAINAMQAMAQSGTMRRALLIKTKLFDTEMVCCTFEDSGPGIGPEHLDHLFDRFFTTKDTGMGMGLPISRSIIEAHGGQIRADNGSVHGGARFSFVLPVADAVAH
jgi:PAS domain S-box-containing protein